MKNNQIDKELYKAAFDSSDLGMAFVSLNWNWLAVNEKFCRLTGYQRSELVSFPLDQLLLPGENGNWEAKRNRLLNGSEQSFQTLKQLRHRDGSVLWSLVSLVLIRDAAGAPSCFLVQFGCTGNQPMNDLLPFEKQFFFQSIFEYIPGALFLMDAHHRLIIFNQAFAQLLGGNPGQFYGQSFVGLIDPRDREMVSLFLQTLQKTGTTTGFDCRTYTAADETQWIHWDLKTAPEDDAMVYGTAKDITAAINLEHEIQSERQRFLDMFHKAPVTMSILKGPHHVFENANELYYKFSGRKNILGKTVREVFPEAEGQGIFELLDKVYQTGQTYTVNERLLQLKVTGDGKLEDFYLSFMYQPFRNADGEVEGIFYFGVDVTEQIVARKKVEASKKLYVDLIQNLPVAVYTTDAHGYLVLFNKEAVALWGRVPTVGRDRWCGSWKIYNASGEQLDHDQSPMAVCIRQGTALQSEEIIIERPDGITYHIVAFPSPVFDISGNLSGAVNVLVDITQRKKVEEEFEKLSLIARKTINAVVITNPSGQIEWVNEAFTKITGYDFHEAVGNEIAALLHGEKTDPATVQLMKEKMNKQQAFEAELIKYNKSGQPFWVEMEVQPLFDGNGKLTHFFQIETEITERKNAYEKLLKTENEIRNFARQLNDKLEEERGRLAREIHDEFGQQLTGLKMSLASLQNLKGNDEQAQRVVNDMIQGVETTIHSLRNFSTELRPGILDTLGLLPSLEWLCREFEKKTGINCLLKYKNIIQSFDEGLSITFFRICQEALTNIAKHAQATQVEIRLLQKGQWLILTVSDNGKGIQTEILEDPFSLGLIGMRERARLIGAELKITSTKNHGTTIQLKANIGD